MGAAAAGAGAGAGVNQAIAGHAGVGREGVAAQSKRRVHRRAQAGGHHVPAAEAAAGIVLADGVERDRIQLPGAVSLSLPNCLPLSYSPSLPLVRRGVM